MIDRTTLAASGGARASGDAGPGSATPPGDQLRAFCRFLSRILFILAVLSFSLSGYLGVAHYWLLSHWRKAEATVVSSQMRQRSSGARNAGAGQSGGSSDLHFVHCTVSYVVAGKTLQSELDSPASGYFIDAQVQKAGFSPGQRIEILYESMNPNRIRPANNPDEITWFGPMEAGLCFLIAGLLLGFISRERNSADASSR